MTNSKNRAELKAELKAKTDKLVSQDKELFANLSDKEITKIKKERAKGFREENRELLDGLKIKDKYADNQEKWDNTEELNEFDWKLSEENIEILIEQSRYHDINNNLEKIKIEEFNKETVEKMMLELLNDYLYRKEDRYVARTNHSYNSEQLDQLNELVSYFVKNMVKIEWIDHKELVEDLIKYKAYKPLFDNLERFKGVNRKEVVEKLLEEYNSSWHNSENYDLLREIANHLEKLEWIIDHKELVERMATRYNGMSLAYNLEKFKWIDYKKLARNLMRRGVVNAVTCYIEKFKWVDRKEIAEEIIEKRSNVHSLLENLKNFDWVIFNFNKKQSEDLFKGELDYFASALKDLYEYWEDQNEDDDFEGQVMRHYNIILSMIDNLEKFEWLNHEELAEKLIENSLADVVAKKIEKFEGVDYKKLAEKIVKSGDWDELVKNISKFPWVTEDDIKVWFKEYQETNENWAY